MDWVRRMQRRLAESGLYHGPISGIVGPMTMGAVLRHCGCRRDDAAELASEMAGALPAARLLETPDRFGKFVAEADYESGGFNFFEENLSYGSVERIMAVWPARTRRVSREFLGTLVRNPRGLAEFVYGGRMGNREPGDGWKYRGRGIFQLTGRDNYRAAGAALRRPYEAQPDLVAAPADAVATAVWFWNRHRLSELVDSGGPHSTHDRVSNVINRGAASLIAAGLDRRRERYMRMRALWI